MTAAATSRRPLVHPEAALLGKLARRTAPPVTPMTTRTRADPRATQTSVAAEFANATDEAVYAEAERRLGRKLTDGERRIDIRTLDRDLAAGKRRLAAAIDAERRSATRAFARAAVAGRTPRMRLRLSRSIRSALRALYDAGRDAGRGELRRAGFDPDNLPKALASSRVPVKLAVIEREIKSRLDVLGTEMEHRLAIAVDLSTATRSAIFDAVANLPGVRAIAADFTTPPTFAGLGSVWDEADAAGVTTSWTYTAVLDAATCDTCEGFDGTTYESWDAIQMVLPDGGPNPDCDGGDRCRCRAVPEFD